MVEEEEEKVAQKGIIMSLEKCKNSKDCPFLAKEDNTPASDSHYLKIENNYKI